jgi:hypothetical protein
MKKYLNRIIRNIKSFVISKFYKPLSKDDILGYRNILKLLYHPSADIVVYPLSTRYLISIKTLHIDLIIDKDSAEILNTTQSYPLFLSKDVLERAIVRITESVIQDRIHRESEMRGRKQRIFLFIYFTNINLFYFI